MVALGLFLSATLTLMSDALVLSHDKRCSFDLGNGVTCGAAIHSRGYCERHYAQLRRAGAFIDPTRQPPSKRDQVLANVATVRKARRRMLKEAPAIVDAFLVGMRNEAANGKTDSARWALTHTHVLEPVAAAPSTSPSSGVTINVGVKVSGTSTKDVD